jgi:hypothetical protein
VATGCTFAPSYAQIDEQPLPRPQPVADADTSSSIVADYGVGSTYVASYAIAVVNSELSMAEVSSSMVAQPSEHQMERSSSPQQQQQGQEQPAEPSEQQPEPCAAQQAVPGSTLVIPEQAATAAAAAAAEAGDTEQPAAEQECAVEAQPEAFLQLQEDPEVSQLALSAEGSAVALPLPADDLDLEAEFADGPALVPEASEEPAGLLSAEDDGRFLGFATLKRIDTSRQCPLCGTCVNDNCCPNAWLQSAAMAHQVAAVQVMSKLLRLGMRSGLV